MSIIFSAIVSFLLSSNIVNPGNAIARESAIPQTTYTTKSELLASTGSTKEDAPLIITRTVTDKELKSRKTLKPEEIFLYTNKERVKYGLKPLTLNAKLTDIADYKCKDMVNKKYFAHIAPNGTDVAGLAIMKNYDYSLIGENLAMGDFLSSGDVVDGWMQSPGHRANILKPTYTEIGISAIPTFINGQMSWYAVQEFGRPSPSCKKPDPKTETFIKTSNNIIDNVNSFLVTLKSQIDKETNREKQNKLIESYNSLGGLAEILHKRTAQTVIEYNVSINAYNNCVKVEDKTIGIN